jgi:hypothetical protein
VVGLWVGGIAGRRVREVARRVKEVWLKVAVFAVVKVWRVITVEVWEWVWRVTAVC